MSSLEFSHWMEYLAEEPVDMSERVHRAQVLSAVSNGPLRKKSGELFTVEDFMRKPWQADEPAAAPASAPTAEQLRAQISAMWHGRT
jgi:hypothetical protein